ncbi:WEB family protein At1g75720-like isoform X2 [Olea europaea var. sylvestris]|uniref:WEB family protein At1g75720-like isoform X2 n=1 Tax=Olea europaea var. sylvestris TaxID=158386 RepID=UPI000C1CFF55|nr:WEB family protein At1g75720-like isoform X2 [Olea europaea var. sylvestris]
MEDGKGMTMMMKKDAEIDTTAPFRSVKEAVVLFGERVLAGELYVNNLQEDRKREYVPSKVGTMKAELEETKNNLKRAHEEGMLMASCLSSMQQELEQTKRELNQLKERESQKQEIDLDIEHLKFVEDSTRFELRTQKTDQKVEFQKNTYMTSVAQVMMPPPGDAAVLERHPSLKKKKKKQLIPFIGRIFPWKKSGSSEIA